MRTQSIVKRCFQVLFSRCRSTTRIVYIINLSIITIIENKCKLLHLSSSPPEVQLKPWTLVTTLVALSTSPKVMCQAVLLFPPVLNVKDVRVGLDAPHLSRHGDGGGSGWVSFCGKKLIKSSFNIWFLRFP